MDDRIFIALFLLGIVAVLCWRWSPAPRLNISALPGEIEIGPAVYLSALPRHRIKDDFCEPTSFPEPYTS